jgi:hypothetical protein
VVEQSITFDLPENWNPAAADIAKLQEQKAEAAARFQALATEIDRRINNLLAIENEVQA